ncbi:ABC transporter ATP-binding protein [Haloparvum sedimenti]|uniref:ABC transporter ATP-binding protein n=1 Tax=Haloparvum sedimenti TaxID=1678448 RepID=UPI00071E96D9|nr:ABC transporter ATP-binding protein [Haloparvum sedimenti]
MNETAADASGATGSGGAAGPASGDEALAARGVRKAYGETVALDGVDLSVERGEVFGLIGPNGAGKTTLVRALTGTTDAEGEVRVLGAAPGGVDPARVGLLPQSFDPPERLTARELVDYYGGLYDDPRDTEEVLADVGLADDADAWYETLSGGQKRRTCVATALVNDPEVLFLDEPTTGIDPAGRRSLHALIEALADDGTTVFLTSHAMDEVERLADRVALIRDGAVVATGTPAGLIADHGGEPHLDVELAVDGDREASGSLDSEAARERVRDRSGDDRRLAVEATDRGLRFSGVEPEGIAAVIDALGDAGVPFESLSWAEPTLEDVYLELTGETYTPRPPNRGGGPTSHGQDDREGGDR